MFLAHSISHFGRHANGRGASSPWRQACESVPFGADRAEAKRLLKLSSSSVLLVPGLMYLKGAINADSIPTFSVGEARDTQSQQQGSGGDVFIVFYRLQSRISAGLTRCQRQRIISEQKDHVRLAYPCHRKTNKHFLFMTCNEIHNRHKDMQPFTDLSVPCMLAKLNVLLKPIKVIKCHLN